MAFLLSGKPFFSFMSLDDDKKLLRKQVNILKRQYSLEEKKLKSVQIMEKIALLKVFQEAKTVMAYWSMDDEVFTHDFVRKWILEKRILLPSVQGDEMILKEFKGDFDLLPGDRFGIPEPAGDEFLSYETIDLILVPGVAFDRNNNRMGRGKAYYDKFLRNNSVFKLGIAFHFQIFDSIPHDTNDIRMDMVIFA